MISQALRSTRFFSIAILVLLLAAPSLAAADCSVQSLSGSYGFVIHGTLTGSPVAIVGQMSTDGTGNISGLETVSQNGVILNSAELLGNYSINSDCSGTLTIQAGGQSRQNFAIALISGGKQFSLVSIDPGTTESGSAEAEGPRACSTSRLIGTYALQAIGSQAASGPVALGGQIIFHGNGTLGGIVTTSVNGVITSSPVGGGYKVNQFCNGAISMAVGERNFIHLNIVVVNGGKGVDFIRVDKDTMVSGTMQQ